MIKIKNNLLWLVTLIWGGVFIVYWQLNPHIATYNNMSLHSSINLVLQWLTAIGIDLVILLISRQLVLQKENLVGLAYKIWVNTIVLGLFFCLILAFINPTDISAGVYDAALPILRGSYPIIVGVILGALISLQILNQLEVKTQQMVDWGILALIAAGMFNAPNIYGWSTNTNVLFYTLLSILGCQSVFHPLLKLSKKQWMLLGSGSLIIDGVLQVVMPYFSVSGSSMSRFATPANLLTIIIVASLIEIFTGKLSIHNSAFIFSYLILIQSTALITDLNANVRSKIGGSSLLNLELTIIVIIGALVFAFIWAALLQHLNLCRRISHRIDRFSQQPLNIQILQVRHWIGYHWANLLAVVISYLLAVILAFWVVGVSNVRTSKGYLTPAYIFGSRQSMLLLTAIIIYFGIKLLQVITRYYWVSIASVIIFNIIFMVGTYEKVITRAEPVLPSDLSALNAELLKMVDAKVYIVVGSALLVIIVLVAFLERKFPVKVFSSWKVQFLNGLVFPLILLSAFFWNQSGKPLNNFITSLGDRPAFYNQLEGAWQNGPTIQFLNNLDVEVMKKPQGYSKQAVLAAVKRYQREAKKINVHRTNILGKQTIIFNLSESFANPSRVPGVKLSQDPIPYINQLKKQTTSGLMISSGYGGGTANMEYMTLTGHALSNFLATISVPYTQLVPALKTVPSIVDSFNHAVAIHPYYGVFYSRIADYKKFGFNKFLYVGSKYKIKHQSIIDRSPYLSDKTAYANALDQIKDYRQGQFINLITMQNHLPYDQNYYNDLKKYEAKKASNGTDMNSLNDYITGIHYTDNAVKNFIKQIDKINKPITIVFYGDHLPGIYGNDMTTDGLKLHETDYFIYSNKYAREHGARKLTTATKYVDPNDFIAMVAKQTNSKVNWYQALLTQVYEKLPAVSLPTDQSGSDKDTDRNQFVNQQGKVISKRSFTKQQRQIWHDYQLIQYDVTAGQRYSIKYFGK